MHIGEPEGKRPVGRPRRRWVDNIKMDLREVGWDGMDWIDLAHGALILLLENFMRLFQLTKMLAFIF
jgi:hypothetical protein